MEDRKGIFAADESVPALEKKFSGFGIPSTDESRRTYHKILFTTPGIEEFLSGVILSAEAFHETSDTGRIFPQLLAGKNILVGVRLEDDAAPTAERMQEYKSLGAVFAKRAVTLPVENGMLSAEFQNSARALAECAQGTQALDLVPVIGIELTSAGSHTASAAEDTLTKGISLIVEEVKNAGADPSGLLLETSMASSGSEAPLQADAQEVAERSFRALKNAVPENTGGILFFSDGETPEAATADLNALARLEPFPWPIAFCFSRALEAPVLSAWQGKEENIPDAQAAFSMRLLLNTRADAGGYGKSMEGG
jgi:fructose-bisphosphate aldolase class I